MLSTERLRTGGFAFCIDTHLFFMQCPMACFPSPAAAALPSKSVFGMPSAGTRPNALASGDPPLATQSVPSYGRGHTIGSGSETCDQ